MKDTIVAYSLLKKFHDERHDLLESFLPFVEYSIVQKSATYIPIRVLQEDCRKTFSISFPLNTLKSLLKKLNRAKRIKPLENYDHIEVLIDSPDTIEDFKQRMDSATRMRNQLIDDFRNFIDNPSLDDGIALSAVTKFIDACLGTIDPLEESLSTLINDSTVGTFAQFVKHIRERNSLAFDTFKDIYFGAILSKQTSRDAIDSVNHSLKTLTVYLDSNILFRILKLQNPVYNQGSIELLNILKSFNFDVRCLLPTVDEMRRVLRRNQNLIVTDKVPASVSQEEAEHTDGILGAIYREHFSLSDLEAFIQNLEHEIEKAGVKVDNDQLEGATPSEALVEELSKIKLEKVLRRQVADETYYDPVEIESVRQDSVPQWLKDSIRKKADLDARIIHWVRRKRGLRCYKLANARIVFLSCDKLLSHYSAASSSNGAVPEVFLEEQFTTLLWLAKPEVAADVPLDLVLSAFSASHFIDYRLLRNFKKYLKKYSDESPDNLQLIGDVFANQELVARLKEAERAGPDDEKVFFDNILERAKQLVTESLEGFEAKIRELDSDREKETSQAKEARLQAKEARLQTTEISERLQEVQESKVADKRRFAWVIYYAFWAFATVLMWAIFRGINFDVIEALFVPERIDYSVVVARAFPEFIYIFILFFLKISYRDTVDLTEAYARDNFPQLGRLIIIVAKNLFKSVVAMFTLGLVPLIRQVLIRRL